VIWWLDTYLYEAVLTNAPTIQTSVLTYGVLQMQTTYLLTYFMRCDWWRHVYWNFFITLQSLHL